MVIIYTDQNQFENFDSNYSKIRVSFQINSLVFNYFQDTIKLNICWMYIC